MCAVTVLPFFLFSHTKSREVITESSIPFDDESVITFTVVESDTESEQVSRAVSSKNKALIKPANYAKSLKKDTYKKPATSYEKPVTKRPQVIIDVPYINQKKKYPTGCESISAVMALKHAGYKISPEYFIDNCLDRAITPYIGKDNKRYGYDPNEYFLGDPYSESGWGCKAPVIVKALNKCINKSLHTVKNLTGTPFGDLKEYLNKGIPVIVWATQDMAPTRVSKTWNIIDTDRSYTWISPNHCLLLVGYDDTGYYFNDPLTHKSCRYEASVVINRYNSMGKQAIVILPGSSVPKPEPDESDESDTQEPADGGDIYNSGSESSETQEESQNDTSEETSDE